MSEDLDYKEQYDKAYKRKKMLEDAIEELKLKYQWMMIQKKRLGFM